MTSSLPMRPAAVFLLCIAMLAATGAQADDDIDEIVVTADFRGRGADELPISISVIDSELIQATAVQHFEELVSIVPNMNWSGDGHRARYFQIRGVGELEQYQGAPNPSVGFLIDDIDFSGIGTIATLFDIERVEILRGPQGSRYGANALAGLIYMQSTLPSAEWSGKLRLSAGDDEAYSAGMAVGGSLDENKRALFRLSAQHFESNGFRSNPYLNRDDTNGRDENFVRGRLLFHASDTVDLSFAALYADVDDGYDAFALDNTYTVLSNQPGKDAQKSIGASVKAEFFEFGALALTSITAFANSDIEFNFDADWGNGDSWQPFVYDFVSENERDRRTFSQEFRLLSESNASVDWLLGVYAMQLDDELITFNRGEYVDPIFNFQDSLDDNFSSKYEATSVAVFGQLDTLVANATRLTVGVRIETRDVEYVDSSGLLAAPSETMTGGEVSLSHDFSANLSGFVTLSKGYKAGGFNLGAVPAGRRNYETESLWNLEAGVKSSFLDDAIRVNAAIFTSRRDDQQVRTSVQLIAGDPASFVFFTGNAAKGEAFGFEADVAWQVADDWQVYASLGMLNAEFKDFVTPQADLSGRGQAHAPNFTLAAGVRYQHPSGWFARLDMSAKDAFYFDVSHDQKSSAYELANVRIGFESSRWLAELWVRNVFDTDYAVRGFYFGNEPPNFPDTLYTRLGDPRQIGVTFETRF